MEPIRVFHLEDYQILRDGVKRLLADDPDVIFVGEADNGIQMFDRIRSIDVDVMVMDIYLDGMEKLELMNGFTICKEVKARYPHIEIVAHSMYEDADKIARILKAGAIAYVSKKSSFGELLHAIKMAANHEVYICYDTTQKLKNLNNFLSDMGTHLMAKNETFSRREREILELISIGKSSKEIASDLFIAERTVETHRKNMIEKAGVKNTAELIAYAVSLGVVKR